MFVLREPAFSTAQPGPGVPGKMLHIANPALTQHHEKAKSLTALAQAPGQTGRTEFGGDMHLTPASAVCEGHYTDCQLASA